MEDECTMASSSIGHIDRQKGKQRLQNSFLGGRIQISDKNERRLTFTVQFENVIVILNVSDPALPPPPPKKKKDKQTNKKQQQKQQ